jgi:transposase InsO family protein
MKIVVFSMDDTMKVSLVNNALNKTITKRRSYVKNERLDNSMVESFFKSLEQELVQKTLTLEHRFQKHLNGVYSFT